MEIKDLRKLSFIIGILMGAFVLHLIIDFFWNISKFSTETILPQGFFVLGLICLFVFYFVILGTIKKKGVFIRINERLLRYFGLAILFLSITSNLLFAHLIDTPNHEGSSTLAVLGGTLIFLSFIFKIGIKIQEEQELTV